MKKLDRENFDLTTFLCSLAWRETCCWGYKAKEKHLNEEHLLYRNFVLGPMALFLPPLPETNAYDFCSRSVCFPIINASVIHSLGANGWSLHLQPLESMTTQIKAVSPFWSLYARTLKCFGSFSLNNIPLLSLEIATGGVHLLQPSDSTNILFFKRIMSARTA